MKLIAPNHIVLSRANLLTLLHKLDVPGSERTLIKVVEGGEFIAVSSEEDASHYAGTRRGIMAPEAEEFIAKHEGLL